MSDVWLCWYLVEHAALSVGRKEMAELSEKYGMPKRLPGAEASATAFTDVCRTRHTYLDESGQTRTLRAERMKSSKQAIQYTIVRDDGYKVGEYKYFPNRMDKQGYIVPGTATTKHVLRRGLDLSLDEQARAWVSKAEALLAERSDLAPQRYVAQHLRDTIETVAVPVRGHALMWFSYDEGVDLLRRCGQLLEDVAPSAHQFTLLRLAPRQETHMLAYSADIFLARQLEDPIVRLSTAASTGEKPQTRSLNQWHQLASTVRIQCVQHERRLGLPLPKTVGLLAQLDDLLAMLPTKTAMRAAS